MEGILFGIIKYYQKRHAAAVLHSTTVQTPWCMKMYNHLDKSVTKASEHISTRLSSHLHRFQLTCKGKGGAGQDTVVVTHEVNLGMVFDGWAECTCNKPKLLHVPCSHVLACLAQVRVDSMPYISSFYLKENVEQTWIGEFYGFMACGNFTVYNSDFPICLSSMDMLRHCIGKGGRPQTRRIRNDMDEAEAGGPMRRCRTCEQFGHKTNACPTTTEGASASTSGSRRGRGRNEDQDYAV